MATNIKSAALICFAMVYTASPAFADKLCLQTTVNKKTFKVKNKSVRAASCPKGYTELADTSSFQGPAGPAGLLDLWSCRLVAKTCNHGAGLNICDANCADRGEFVLQHRASAISGNCQVDASPNTVGTSLTFPNGLSAGVRYLTSAPCSYTATINVVCCPTS